MSTVGSAAPADSDSAAASAVDADLSAAALPGWAVVLIVLAGLGVLAAIVVLVLRRMRSGGDDRR